MLLGFIFVAVGGVVLVIATQLAYQISQFTYNLVVAVRIMRFA
jgi:hypothetical protein